MRLKEKCKTEKGYKIYNFIIIISDRYNSFSESLIFQLHSPVLFYSEGYKVKVILNFKRQQIYTLHSIYVSEGEKYGTPSFEIT